ncbi:hypothetical protein MUN89_12020 [Halobacillus salinarum]|uniref:Uncharacterized protein n=1 Tax=Halobacillus salinarum TaxID=2932257 RepID=A0ABY4EE26_9BACI|nr:hypothetical protein [Halobacillus salinarum]UOQ42697.1 hypothetical protein MUN89_12020 [Halobacillus salinarum]
MEAQYYWYCWFVFIIVYFLFPPSHLQKGLSVFVLLLMSSYGLFQNTGFHDILLLGIVVIFGLIFWINEQKSLVTHFWPFILCLGYAACQMFLFIHPIWHQFPGFELSLVLFILVLHWFSGSFSSAVGFWMLVNGLGSLVTIVVLEEVEVEQVIIAENIIVFLLKGMVLLFILFGMARLKRSVRRSRNQSRKKGAAHA